jgi:hypothetical protein
MQPISSGGIPPAGPDFNGILNWITQHTAWQNAGGQYPFSSSLAAAIGGYSAGMAVTSSQGTIWYSLINGNSVDPATGPFSVTASVATNVLTVTATAGVLAVGMSIVGVGIPDGTTIASLGTGTGGNGTYNLSTTPGTIASETMAAWGWAAGGTLWSARQPFVGAVPRNQTDKNTDIISVKDWGAKADGNDDAPGIQLALANCPAGGCVIFPYGAYNIGSQLTATRDDITLKGIGKPTIKAMNGTNFEYMLLATGRTNVMVESLIFDANKAGRTSGQTIRFCGATFIDCIDSTMENCTAKNTRGYGGISATGLGFGGNCIRCQINLGRLINCGDLPSNNSDGIYTSGTDNLISNCIAKNCTDTAFVIEESNNCGIVGCISDGCSSGGAITNILDTDCGGNYINGLTVKDWNAAVTGGICIGCLVAGKTGNLLDTLVSNVVMVADTAGGYGNGPAIYVRTIAVGKTKGIEFSNISINGATAQGFLVEGDDVSIKGGSIKKCAGNALQWATGSLRGYASNFRIDAALSPYAVATVGTSDLTVECCYINNSAIGIYAGDTSTIRSIMNTILNPTITYESKAAGATLERLTMIGGYLSSNKVAAGAPAGSVTKQLSLVDQTGNIVGTIPLYV